MIFRSLFTIFFAIAFLLPTHYYPWPSFYLEFSAFLALFIAVAGLMKGQDSLHAPKMFLVFFGFSTVALIQFVCGLSLFRGDAVLAFFYVTAFGLTLIVSRLYAANTDHKATEALALALAIIGLISVWVAMIQWLQLWSSPWIFHAPSSARPFANLGQANNYSSLVWVALFSLYYLFERKQIGRVGLFLAGGFLLAGAALTQSRTSWVMLSVLTMVAIGHKGLFVQWRWQRLALPLSGMVAFYVLSVAATELKGFLFYAEKQELRLGFTDVRIDLWLSYIQAILERPWFGFGWGQVSVAQSAVSELFPTVGLAQYSHNLLLDLLVWNGIPIGVLFFAMISYLWLRIFFCAYTQKGFYSLCCFTALLVHALLEYPHAYSYFLLLAGFFIGISASEPIEYRKFRRIRWLTSSFVMSVDRWFSAPVRVSKYISVSVVVIFAVSLIVAWKDYRTLEEDHRLLRFEVASIGTLKADQKAPDVIFFDQLQSFTWVARTHSFDGLTDDEQKLLEKVAARYPLPMPLYKLAQLRVTQGRPEDAIETLGVIRHLYGEKPYSTAEETLNRFIKQRAADIEDAE